MPKTKTIKIYLELPADTILEQIFDGSGKVISTVVEANLNLEEIHRGLSEFENAITEYAWGSESK